ncbi:substrate-binding domain-containing protein [Gracilibacillus kekensis]|uniref:Monosaccharide ABC transporter substrate-binding protein, CUT2 family n=1 Tax=Gracilibacillus kekensis TaxID=1027249 RepID=A0A1M7MV77_9BACI|nr:substrate-binding domain-containing protein [Gracilibacillus kekensis]SHM94925.1 monosaccharide ABC transporter substrate-binding protein, CUT2 family [Gracilibacillus kekensis]
MKKLMQFMLVIMIGLLLVACTDNSDESTTEDTSNEQDNTEQENTDEESEAEEEQQSDSSDGTYTIGISLPAATHGWMGAMVQNTEAEAQKHDNIEYSLVTADDPAQQSSDIDDLITQGVDAIVMLPLESAALTPTAEKIAEAGIPLINVDRGLETENFRTYIGGDNYGIGWVDGQYLVEGLIERNGEPAGKVVEISGVPSTVTDLRSQGFRDYIADYPDIEIVASQPGDFTAEASLAAMENILLANDEIDAVFSQDDDMTVGIVQAIKDAQREEEMFIVSSGGMKEIYNMMIEGTQPEVTVSVTYTPKMGAIGVNLATKILAGETLDGFQGELIPHNIVLDATPITPENVEDYFDPDANY